MPDKRFTGRKALILQEKQFILSDLARKIRALAHPTRNGHACAEAWPFACVMFLVSRAKFYIFRHGRELGNRLDCVFSIAFLDIFETRHYYLCNVSGLRWIVLRALWGE